MKTLSERLGRAVADTVRELYDVTAPVEISRPEAKFGDFATNVALKLAGELHRAPREIAEEVANEFVAVSELPDAAHLRAHPVVTGARRCSVKSAVADSTVRVEQPGDNAYAFAEEKTVLLKLDQYPEVVRTAADRLEPHHIATYLYELAREMNRYYDSVRVADAPEPARSARLSVLEKVAGVFERGLAILGIEVPEKM